MPKKAVAKKRKQSSLKTYKLTGAIIVGLLIVSGVTYALGVSDSGQINIDETILSSSGADTSDGEAAAPAPANLRATVPNGGLRGKGKSNTPPPEPEPISEEDTASSTDELAEGTEEAVEGEEVAEEDGAEGEEIAEESTETEDDAPLSLEELSQELAGGAEGEVAGESTTAETE